MDIPSVFTSGSASTVAQATNNATTSQPTLNSTTADFNIDPLAGYGLGNETISVDGKREELVTNETINTSDKSKVGNFSEIQDEPAPAPEPEPTVEPAAPSVIQTPVDTTFNVTDPVKLDFIKTYTSEYDATVARALVAVQALLKSIDETVKNHTDDIAIPESANEFIDQAPAGGRVPKFDDAQNIVRTVMEKANTAKSQSEEAAREAAKIYDDIQKFKHDTEDEVKSIKSRDEFGRTESGMVK